jgi:hypothetical protein
MPKNTVILVILLFISFSAFSQKTTISGVLTDGNEKTPVYNSVVALLTPKDSILYAFTRSKRDRLFARDCHDMLRNFK